MPVANSLENYLCDAHVNFDVINHSLTQTAYDSACSAKIPAANVMKAVLLRDLYLDDYIIAVIPACNKLNIPWINQELSRDLMMAEESELKMQFPDCTVGAVPALAQAYDISLIWDDQLAQQPEFYFEAGNHQSLVHFNKEAFDTLFAQQPHATISYPAEHQPYFHNDEMRSSLN